MATYLRRDHSLSSWPSLYFLLRLLHFHKKRKKSKEYEHNCTLRQNLGFVLEERFFFFKLDFL